jgi:hypothetical protein
MRNAVATGLPFASRCSVTCLPPAPTDRAGLVVTLAGSFRISVNHRRTVQDEPCSVSSVSFDGPTVCAERGLPSRTCSARMNTGKVFDLPHSTAKDGLMPPLTNVPPAPGPDAALRASARIPLLHVTDRLGRAGLATLLQQGEIPTSAEEYGYCGPHARFVEDQIAHPRCVYFYAGRALPAYGRVALAFARAEENARLYSSTPFDSGGIVRPDAEVHLGFRLNLNPDNLANRVEYCRQSIMAPPTDWREDFARWLGAYFPAGPGGYWDAQPQATDPEGLYSSGNPWPAWAWEVRLQRGTAVTDAEAWTCDIGYLNELDTQLGSVALGEDVLAALAAFRGRNLTPTGSATFCEELEAWTRQQCVPPS